MTITHDAIKVTDDTVTVQVTATMPAPIVRTQDHPLGGQGRDRHNGRDGDRDGVGGVQGLAEKHTDWSFDLGHYPELALENGGHFDGINPSPPGFRRTVTRNQFSYQ